MKAQMSLEMIIGLLILLVVAAVVISLFMDRIKQITQINDWQSDMEYKKFKATCESYCKDTSEGSLPKFCSEKLKKKDLDGDGKVDTLKSDTSVLSMCEDAIYCFHVASCEKDGDVIGAKECKGILCRAWSEVYGDVSKTSAKVMELVPGYGTCELPEDENWWKIAKFGPNPPCGGSFQSPVSFNCEKTDSTSVTCVWSCPAVNQASLLVSGTSYAVAISATTGSETIPNLTPGQSYTITMLCDVANSAYSAVKVVQL